MSDPIGVSMEPSLKFYGGRLGAAVPLLLFVVWAIAISVAGAVVRKNSIGVAKQPIGTHDASRSGQVSR